MVFLFGDDTFCRSRIHQQVEWKTLKGRSPFDLQPFFCAGFPRSKSKNWFIKTLWKSKAPNIIVIILVFGCFGSQGCDGSQHGFHFHAQFLWIACYSIKLEHVYAWRMESMKTAEERLIFDEKNWMNLNVEELESRNVAWRFQHIQSFKVSWEMRLWRFIQV